MIRLADLRAEGSPGRREALAALSSACRRQGYGLLEAPELRSTIGSAYDQSSRFHQLPDRHKASIHNERNGGRGWVPLLTEPAYVANTVARCESFDLAQEHPPVVVGGHEGVIGPNVWPEPALLPSFETTVYGLYERLRAVAGTLFAAFADTLDIDRERFVALDTDHSPSMMRLLHYPGRSEALSPTIGEVGISTHTDFEAFTLMHQSAPGLQLRRPDGVWIDAPSAEDSLIVIIGDVLERLTNGHLTATPHRVPDNDWERYSIILFCAIDAEAIVEPMAPYTSSTSRFEPISQVAHLKGQVAAALDKRDRVERSEPQAAHGKGI